MTAVSTVSTSSGTPPRAASKVARNWSWPAARTTSSLRMSGRSMLYRCAGETTATACSDAPARRASVTALRSAPMQASEPSSPMMTRAASWPIQSFMICFLPVPHFHARRAGSGPARAEGPQPAPESSRGRDDSGEFVPTLVEPEGRVLVGHEAGVDGDPHRPPVQADNQGEDVAEVLAAEQQHHAGDEGEDADQPEVPAPAARNDADDEVLGE